jgi:ADP-heptose:LPS heptosyltransferase
MLCQTIDADEYIGQIGDLDWTSIPIMAKLANLTHVVPNYTARSTFEFDNNVDFFTRATDEKISLKMHEIKRKKNTVKDTIVISPCAQDGYRMWHINNFVHILNWLIKNGKNVVLVGGKNDAKYLNKLNNKVNSKCTVMAGMPWNNLIDTINNAELFIGMDSGNLHLAISLQTPAVAISSGMSYTRFMAYPKSDKYKIVFAPNTLDELTKYVSKPRNKTTFCPFIGSINSVSVSQVIDAANKLLQKRKK